GLLRAESLPGEDVVLRARATQVADEPLAATASGNHPQPNLGLAELRSVGGDSDVTRHRQLQPRPEAVAINRDDHRLGAAGRRSEVASEVDELMGLDLHESGNVAAGAERLSFAADHH